MSLALALDAIVPGALYQGSLTDDTEAAYDSLIWLDVRPKPLYSKVVAAVAQILKADLKAFAAAERYNRQTAGYSYRGRTFDTDPDSVAAFNTIYVLAQANPSYSTSWKLSDGSFTPMDATTIISTYNAIVRFTQALFTAESVVSAAVDSGSMTTYTQVTTQINSVPNVG
jgi:hypothetical protein